MIVPKIGAHEKYSFVGTLCRTHLFATTPYPQKIGFGVVAACIGGTDECGAFVRRKVETGDRRLDIFEFIDYCRALNWQPEEVLQSLQEEAV